MKLKPFNILIAFLSSAFQAFGMYNIHALADITEGGVLGATLLLEHWFGVSPALSSFVMNALCFLLGWRVLGKSFIAYSLIAACGYSLGYESEPCDQAPHPVDLPDQRPDGAGSFPQLHTP